MRRTRTIFSRRVSVTHAPFAQGRCFDCHETHQAAYPALLVKEGDKLCLGCHESGTVQKKHPNFPAEVKNCGTCHSPHGSDNRHLIRNVLHEPFSTGCNDCHVQKGVPVGVEKMASSHNHLVRYGKNGCIACHSPHAADDKRLLKGKERYICSTCHSDTFKRYDTAHYKHMTTDSCTDCHVPHGSNYPNMTKGPINSVCAPCHEKHTEFTHPIGETVFDPRTLQTMTCVTCHSVKGSEHYKHLRLDGHKDLCVQCHRNT
jgi:predicted CXXCH cytochrome family protein